MHLNQKIIETLDDSYLNKFIKLVYNAVKLFDKNVSKEYDFNPHRVLSLSSPVHDAWHIPEFNLPLFRLLHIKEGHDRFVVLHYAKSYTLVDDVSDPNSGPLVSFDYILFFSYRCFPITTILNDDFSELYTLLVKENLLFPVTSELQQIFLLSC